MSDPEAEREARDVPEQPAAAAPEAERREPVFNLPPVVVTLIAVCVVIHLIRVYLLTVPQDLELLIRAAFIPIRYSGQFPIDVYAFTTPLTYSLLHGGLAHLAINMIWLAAFGSPLANRMGWQRFVCFWAVTSVAAAGLHYVLHAGDHAPLVGASGAISGMMGAAARFAFRIDRSEGRAAFRGEVLPVATVLRLRGVLTFLAVWMAVNLVTGLVGFTPGSDDRIAWEAHIGGFLAGFLGVAYFDRPRTL